MAPEVGQRLSPAVLPGSVDSSSVLDRCFPHSHCSHESWPQEQRSLAQWGLPWIACNDVACAQPGASLCTYGPTPSTRPVEARRQREVRVRAHQHAREFQRAPQTRGHLHDRLRGPCRGDPGADLVVLGGKPGRRSNDCPEQWGLSSATRNDFTYGQPGAFLGT